MCFFFCVVLLFVLVQDAGNREGHASTYYDPVSLPTVMILIPTVVD
jgi:hypothetical protein